MIKSCPKYFWKNKVRIFSDSIVGYTNANQYFHIKEKQDDASTSRNYHNVYDVIVERAKQASENSEPLGKRELI